MNASYPQTKYDAIEMLKILLNEIMFLNLHSNTNFYSNIICIATIEQYYNRNQLEKQKICTLNYTKLIQ